MSTTADANGSFSLSGTFDDATRFRATKDGHLAATQVYRTFPWVSGRYLIFSLEVPAPPVNMAGDYTLTFIANSACADLPTDLRRRSYDATIALATNQGSSTNSWFIVKVRASQSLEPHFDGFNIGVAGDYLAAQVGDLHGGPGLVEPVGSNRYVTFGGELEATVTDRSTIVARLVGSVDGCELATSWSSRRSCSDGAPAPIAHAQCFSSHQLIFSRR
jgi:hypothetical protein